MAVGLDVLDLEIGDRGLEFRIPVDEAFAAIDEPLVVEVDEDLEDRRRQPVIHGEAGARPVAGRAEAFQLPEDRALGFALLLPDALDEGLAAHVGAADIAFLGQFALDDHLGRDPGMVRARLPERVIALHALPADQHVLQRVVERVAHMQRARDIGRRDHDAKVSSREALAPAAKQPSASHLA